jgi:hypothetical protein
MVLVAVLVAVLVPVVALGSVAALESAAVCLRLRLLAEMAQGLMLQVEACLRVEGG